MDTRLSKLKAINLMLRGAGELPVNTLANDGTNDTQLAQEILDQEMIRIQAQGWNYNTEIQELSPDSDGHIDISDRYLRVDSAEEDVFCNYVYRNQRLYDVDNNTDVFSGSVTLKIIKYLDWEDIPTDFQLWIAQSAAVKYQARTQQDPNTDQVLRVEEMEARVRALSSDSQSRDASWIDPPKTAQRYVSRRRYRARGY